MNENLANYGNAIMNKQKGTREIERESEDRREGVGREGGKERGSRVGEREENGRDDSNTIINP